jgi:phosphoglycolate phosphatase-like HAD superfamily hydrolase
MRIFLAFRAFFATLFRADSAERIRNALAGNSSPVRAAATNKQAADEAAKDGLNRPSVMSARNDQARNDQARNDAITMLAVLQRDARLLDLVHESLDDYSDEQIGGAARNVLRDTRKALEKVFGLRRLVDVAEGDRIEIPNQSSPIRWRVLGSGANSTEGSSGSRGTLVHAGWIASKTELPTWTGKKEDVLVVAPAEVETGA